MSDRQRFLSELDANFSVQAAAGTGKTTALVGRIAALAREKPETLDRLVVVTYTHRAADEMRQRVQAELFPSFADGRAGTLAQHFSRIFIGTIHSFCLRLIREYGLWLGYGASPVTEGEDDALLFRDFVRQRAPEAEPAWLAHVHRAVTAREISALARELSRRAVDWSAVAGLPGPNAAEREAALLALKIDPEALADVTSVSAKARETIAHWISRWREMAAAWNAADGAFVPMPAYDGKEGGKGLQEAWPLQLAKWGDPMLEAVLHAAVREAAAYQEFRLRAGRLFFGDQIVLAHRLLRQPEVRARLLGEGFHILLDEAQDTDPLQFQLLAELARPPESGLFSWPAADAEPPLPGRFVMVGDGQQAIYRERASIDVYRRYHDAVGRSAHGACLTFSETYRCRPGVAAFVNDRFPHVLTGEPGQARFVPLKPENRDTPGRVVRWQRPKMIDGSGRKEAAEAAWLARELGRLGPAGLGARNWGEVAILCPKRAWLTVIHEALRKEGIPSLLHFDLPRAHDPAYLWLTALLTLQTDPGDEFEVAGLLRELYGVSDAAIYRFRYRDGLARPRRVAPAPFPSPDGPVEAFLDAWHRRRGQTERLPLALAVSAWIEESRLRDRLAALGAPGTGLERLLLQAHAAQQEGRSLREFHESLRRGLEEPGAVQAASGGETVELMTMKKAKGLQWDAVVIPFLGHQDKPGGQGDYPKVFLPLDPASGEGEEEVPLALSPTFASSTLRAAIERNQEEAERERRRLYYVACTRARHTLVFVDDAPVWERETKTGVSLPGPNGYTGMLGPQESAEAFANPLELSAALLSETPLAAEAGGKTALPAQADAWPEKVELAPLLLATKKAPSRHETEEEPLSPAAESLLPRREWIEEMATEGTDYGTWWHETLRLWPWGKDAAAFAALAVRQLPEGPAQERGARELEAFRRSALHGLLAALPAEARLQEIPYSRLREADGRIDFLYREPEGTWVLLDWKTDTWNPRELSREAFAAGLAERYGAQLHAYGEALAGFFPGMETLRSRIYSTALDAVLDL
ncbi:MAG: UvrD-helicase domain-containing protein [Verrucomicrobium sp.]|nr:UvrD-helicase domain-containing protein [Verrucomicrobium sp.]